MSYLHHLTSLANSQHTKLPTPLRVLLIVALAFTLLIGLAARAVVAVAVLIFGSH